MKAGAITGVANAARDGKEGVEALAEIGGSTIGGVIGSGTGSVVGGKAGDLVGEVVSQATQATVSGLSPSNQNPRDLTPSRAMTDHRSNEIQEANRDVEKSDNSSGVNAGDGQENANP